MERATARLRIVIPLTLFLIFLLLYCNFRNASPHRWWAGW